MYAWRVRAGEIQYGSGWYDHKNGYPRQGGSGKGVALKTAYRVFGFKNRMSDAEIRQSLQQFPADADLIVDKRGAITVAPQKAGSQGIVRRSSGTAQRTLRSPSSPRGDIPLTVEQERDAWDAGYEARDRFGPRRDPEDAFLWALQHDRRLLAQDGRQITEDVASFWEYEFAFLEGFAAYGTPGPIKQGSKGLIRTGGHRQIAGATRDRPFYEWFVIVSRLDEEADPAVIDSGWGTTTGAHERSHALAEELEDDSVIVRVFDRKLLMSTYGIDPSDDGRWR